jgi:hypothetical protein
MNAVKFDPPRQPARPGQAHGPMTDLLYVAITVLFFVVGGLYVRFCEKL